MNSMLIWSHLNIMLFYNLFQKQRSSTRLMIGNLPGFDVEDTDQLIYVTIITLYGNKQTGKNKQRNIFHLDTHTLTQHNIITVKKWFSLISLRLKFNKRYLHREQKTCCNKFCITAISYIHWFWNRVVALYYINFTFWMPGLALNFCY